MSDPWLDANQRFMSTALAGVRELLAWPSTAADEGGAALSLELDQWPEGLEPPALETLVALFDLSPFERALILLCAGVELDAALATEVAARGEHAVPTFGLALAVLPDAHWSALSPGRPLRRWRLVEVSAGETLVRSPLRLDERVLHFLVGVSHLDEHLLGFVRPVRATEGLVPSQRALAEGIAQAWQQGADELPVVQLVGGDPASRRAIAADAGGRLGLALHVLEAHSLPTAPADLDVLARLWEREAALSGSALLLEVDGVERGDTTRRGLVTQFAESVGGVLLLAGDERWPGRHRPTVTFHVARPTSGEQRALWEQALGPTVVAELNGQVEQLVAHFDLDARGIHAACTRVGTAKLETLGTTLWRACRAEARPRLDDLAQRIEPIAGWDDLILPERQRDVLREIAIHVRQRMQVYEGWGFAGKSARGLGISALFSGTSGTGKTMAAEVLANTLDLDLYRIDLSQVVSKYIGETEKNLRRVFDAAEAGGAILLFDEADALFGKRSEVKDSHDRYANIEVSYLLQRMESYRGLAILTTNMKGALDDAFLRRLRFVVAFPFPDAAQRAAIWRGIFPSTTPTDGLATEQLAQLNVAGGNIRNIALHAAFLAADAGEAIGMAHVLRATRQEYAKLEKPLTDAETRGWGRVEA